MQLKKSQKTRDSLNDQNDDEHIVEREKQVEFLTPIISKNILGNLQNLPDATLKKNITEFCNLSIELTLSPNQDVRTNNKELLSRMFKMLTTSRQW